MQNVSITHKSMVYCGQSSKGKHNIFAANGLIKHQKFHQKQWYNIPCVLGSKVQLPLHVVVLALQPY